MNRENWLAGHTFALASTTKMPPEQFIRVTDCLYDVKWDGVRALAYCEGGQVTLLNRNHVDITERYPDVAAALAAATAHYARIVLDGEIVVFDESGLANFGLVAKRDRVKSLEAAERAMRTLPATFVAFDMLDLNGTSVCNVPYGTRRQMLEVHMGTITTAQVILSPATTDGAALWAAIQSLGAEGVIAKGKEGGYPNGRSSEWVKLKDNKRVTCIVTGWKPGSGAKEGMVGALTLGLLPDTDPASTPVDVGKVGTGFSDEDRRNLQRYFDELPDAYDPLDESFGLRVEVEYLNFTTDGRLRFPSFKGMRYDVPLADCQMAQLDRGA